MQYSTTLRQNKGNQIGTTLGATGGFLTVYTGTPPGIANAPTGTLLVTLTSVSYSTTSGVTTVTCTAATAAASGTPGYARLLTSGSVAHIEGFAGIGTQATTTGVAVSGGAVTTVNVLSGGSGYPVVTGGATTPPPIVTFSGGGGWDAVFSVSTSGGAVTSVNIINGGYGFTSPPTITISPPFDFTFNQAISLGGNVSETSFTITEGNI